MFLLTTLVFLSQRWNISSRGKDIIFLFSNWFSHVSIVRWKIHYVIGISGILPYKHFSRTLEILVACTVLSHGSIMLPPREPRVFARLGSLAIKIWALCVITGHIFSIELRICNHEILEISYARKNLKKIHRNLPVKGLNRTIDVTGLELIAPWKLGVYLTLIAASWLGLQGLGFRLRVRVSSHVRVAVWAWVSHVTSTPAKLIYPK